MLRLGVPKLCGDEAASTQRTGYVKSEKMEVREGSLDKFFPACHHPSCHMYDWLLCASVFLCIFLQVVLNGSTVASFALFFRSHCKYCDLEFQNCVETKQLLPKKKNWVQRTGYVESEKTEVRVRCLDELFPA